MHDLISTIAILNLFSHGTLKIIWASPVAQLIKNPPAMQETLVQFLGREDPLEKGRLPTPVFWPREFHGQSMGSQRVGRY